MAETIRNVMSTDPVSLPASAPITKAAQAMRDSDIGDVIVLDDSQQVCGIVTDRDITVRAIADGRDPSSTKLGDICTRELQSLGPDASVGDAVRLMTDKAIRRLPILDGGKPVGIVSIGDLAATHDPESGLADISSAPANN
ncbi:MAG: CBS domain-containing protein [Actinomycetota bacterium]